MDAEEEEEAGCLGGREPLGGGCGTAADIGVSSSSSPVENWVVGVRGRKKGRERRRVKEGRRGKGAKMRVSTD